MARNGSGTMTIPNTMVSGQAITASAHNQNYSDIGSEITNSVAADGQTTMTGPLKSANGSAAAPSISFASDTDSGWYRKAANSLALTLDGVDRIVFTTASATFSCAVTISNEFIASATSTFILTANFSTKPVVPAKSFAISKIADGTANRLYGTDGSGVATEITLGNGVALSGSSLTGTAQLPRGYIDGCLLSNGTDTVNDINVAAGVCRDSTNAVNITVAAMAGKQLDANWAPGASAGMRNSGAGIADGTYHIYAVAKADGTQDIYAHTSTTVATVITALQAETGGSSYIYARLIGSIVRATTILQFTQNGDDFYLNTPVLDISNATPGTSAVTGTLTSAPTGVVLRAILQGTHTVNGQIVYVSALSGADLAPSATAAPLSSFGGSATAFTDCGIPMEVYTNTSAQIRYRSSTNNQLYILTRGWKHPRGKDA